MQQRVDSTSPRSHPFEGPVCFIVEGWMNWEAVGAIGEILGAVAVVASLVFLAAQVRSNTRAMRARAGFDATTAFADMNEGLARSILGDPVFQNGGESRFASMIATVFDSESDPGQLAASEQLVVDLIHRAIFEKLKATFYLYQHGYIEPALWEQRRNLGGGIPLSSGSKRLVGGRGPSGRLRSGVHVRDRGRREGQSESSRHDAHESGRG